MSAKYVFPKTLKELRIHFPQTGGVSSDIKSFLTSWYPSVKKANPTTPILIREAIHARPTVYARFDFGKEAKIHLDAVPKTGIEKAIQTLIESQK